MSSGSSGERAARLRRWLRPGTGIKRWLLVMFLGLTILATAGALIIRILFRDVPSHTLAGQAFELLSLNFLPMPLQPIVVIGAGVAVFVLGRWSIGSTSPPRSAPVTRSWFLAPTPWPSHPRGDFLPSIERRRTISRDSLAWDRF